MKKELLNIVKERRTFYGIGKSITLTDENILELIQHAIKHSPTAFNSQSGRVVVLFGQHHEKLWHMTKETLRKMMPGDAFPQTEAKINSFSDGYGTILYFEDQSIIEGLQNQFPTYKDNFPVWSQQGSGMLQYIVWTLLESEGLGVSLQHYNPIIDDAVRNEWHVPANWKLVAQMPFGAPTASPAEKQFYPVDTRIKVFK